jgi:hypothetical protein
MNHQRNSKLRQFLEELVSGHPHAGETSVSSQFTLEEGMDRTTYLAHERDMFQRIGPLYRLQQGWRLETEDPHVESGFHGLESKLINQDGNLVYEWAHALDENGLLIGNGSRAQTVSKMQHADGKWSRALAVTSPIPIVSFRPLFPCAWQKRMDVSDDGLFWSFCFLPEDDSGRTFWGKFRIRYSDHHVEEKTIWLRGLDRPHFLNPNFSLSDDRKTLTHDARLPWSVDVRFDDGETAYLEFPRTAKLVFSKPVQWACLTDALDHDWIVSNGPLDFLDF